MIFNKAGKFHNIDFNLNGVRFECVSRYKYLGVYFCLSGSFTYAQEDLYNKSLKAYFKFSKEFLSLKSNIHIGMHVFDHTIKPILLYGCEIWDSFNPFTSKFRKGLDLVDLEQIYSKLYSEKMHQKFCKYILGVHKKATNLAVLSELSRHPLYFNIVKSMLNYYLRLEKTDSTFPLLNDAYIESKLLHLMQRSHLGTLLLNLFWIK